MTTPDPSAATILIATDSTSDFAAQARGLESVLPLTAMAERVRPTVLVVDDDKLQRKIVSKVLGDGSYHLVCAAGGVEALSIMRKTRPDRLYSETRGPGYAARQGGQSAACNLSLGPTQIQQLLGRPAARDPAAAG